MSMFLGYCLQKGDVDWYYLTSSLVLSVWKWKEITVEAAATFGVKFKTNPNYSTIDSFHQKHHSQETLDCFAASVSAFLGCQYDVFQTAIVIRIVHIEANCKLLALFRGVGPAIQVCNVLELLLDLLYFVLEELSLVREHTLLEALVPYRRPFNCLGHGNILYCWWDKQAVLYWLSNKRMPGFHCICLINRRLKPSWIADELLI